VNYPYVVNGRQFSPALISPPPTLFSVSILILAPGGGQIYDGCIKVPAIPLGIYDGPYCIYVFRNYSEAVGKAPLLLGP